MLTSALGNKSGNGSGNVPDLRSGHRAGQRFGRAGRHSSNSSRGFSLIELMVVFAIIALGVGMVVLALPDGDESKLEEEGERLGALLEMARAEARVAGVAVRWVPRADNLPGAAQAAGGHFAFSGLPGKVSMPTRWLDSRTQAQVRGATFLVLGPDAILPAQKVLLSLGNRRLELASDGLAPFAPGQASAANTAAGAAQGAQPPLPAP